MPSLVRCRARSVPIAVLAIAMIFGARSATAQSEDQVKAAFLFNFARYVEWPADAFNADGSIRICLLGAPEFASVVSSTVAGKQVGDRALEVMTPGALGETRECHILYVGGAHAEAPGTVARSVDGASVFTVADRTGFAQGGGIANFVRADNKVRFEINPSAAQEAGLKVSSRLLRLAKVVK